MGQKLAEVIKELPNLNREAAKMEAEGSDIAIAWGELQERWKESLYIIDNPGRRSECPKCGSFFYEGEITIVNNLDRKKKNLEVPYSVIHFIDEHPKEYKDEPVYGGKLPKQKVFEALGLNDRRWWELW